jgi:hypothetical protein
MERCIWPCLGWGTEKPSQRKYLKHRKKGVTGRGDNKAEAQRLALKKRAWKGR